MADVDGDGTQDILYGEEGTSGQIRILEAATGTEFISFDNPGDGVTSLVVADLNQDGSPEIGWGAGDSDSGPNNWYIVDAR